MADKDVKLVIRARNEASKAIDSVAEALKDLSKAQKQTADTADKTSDLIDELGSSFDTLKKEAQGLEVLGKVAGAISKVEAAVSTLEDDVKKSAAALEAHKQELADAAAATAKYEAEAKKVAAALEAEKAATKAARDERSAANKMLGDAERAHEKLRKQIEKKPSDSGKSQLAVLAGEVKAAKAILEETEQTVEAQVRKQNSLKKTLSAVNAEVRSSQTAQSKLADQIERAGEAAKKSEANLADGRRHLTAIKAAASEAAQALGGVTVSQEALEAASKQTAEAISRAQAELTAMERFSDGRGGFTDPKSAAALRQQTAAVKEARQNWEMLEARVALLADAMRKATAPTEQMTRDLAQARAAAAAARKEFEAQTATLNKMPSATQNARNGMKGIFSPIYGESRQAMSMLQRMRGEVLALATAYVGLYATIEGMGGVLKTYQAREAAESRLGVVFQQNSTLIRSEIDWIDRQAARLGITFTTLSDSYGKFAVSASKANFGAQATRDVFLAVAEAGRVNKLSMDDMRGVFVALEQMISKGKVSAEELRQQMGERLPGAFAIMAKSLDVTTERLDKMLQSGEVFANEETLLKFAQQLNKEFGSQLAKSLTSTTTLMGKFGYEVEQAQLRVANGGFIEGFNELLAEMNEWFQSREGRDFFLELGATAGTFAKALALVPQHLDTLGYGLKAIVAIKFAQTIQGIVTRLIELGRESAVAATNIKKVEVAAKVTGEGVSFLVTQTKAATAATVLNRAALLSSVSAYGLGRTATIGLTGALVGLRSVATAATTALRGLYMAVGGWAGIALTALSFLATELITRWVSGVDEATTAMDEHKRITDEVLGTYERLGKKTKDWAKEIKNVTLLDAEKNFSQQFKGYEKALADLKKAISKAEYGISSDALEEGERLAKLLRTFDPSKIDEFHKALLDLNGTIKHGPTKELVQDVDSSIKALKEQRQVLGEATVSAQAKGSADERLAEAERITGASIESLTKAAKSQGDVLGDTRKALEKYADALNTIKGMIPELANELKKLEELNKLDAAFKEIQNLGFDKDPEARNRYNQAKQAIIDKTTNWEAKFIAEGITNPGKELEQLVRQAAIEAKKRNLKLEDVLTVISYETGGTFDKNIPNKKGTHKGLIQFGPEEQRVYGIVPEMSMSDQVKAVFKFFDDRGLKPGDNLLRMYATVNGGNPNAINVSDFKNGGMPGTVLEKVATQMEGHKQRAKGLVDAYSGVVEEADKIVDAEKKANDERIKGEESTTRAIEDTQFEITQQDRIIAGKEREAFIEEKMRAAKERDKSMGPEREAELRRELGLLWDKQNRLVGVKKAEEEVNRLMQLRKELMEQIEFFQNQGETAKAEQLRGQLEQVNAQLIAAADNAIAMWQAIGGAEAELAIMKLQTTKLQVQDLGNKSNITGKQINEMLADGLVNAFDRFAQAVANGENAVDALWTAFRQFASDFLIQIAKMILKQAILNALQAGGGQGGGVGGIIAGAIGAMFHDGGIVGAGGTPRLVSPGWYANAAKYHEGGIVGLNSDEQAAVLRDGEVVDPGDGSVFSKVFGGLQAQPAVVKIINAIDSADVVSQGLNSPVGEQAVLNFMRANRGAIREIVG